MRRLNGFNSQYIVIDRLFKSHRYLDFFLLFKNLSYCIHDVGLVIVSHP